MSFSIGHEKGVNIVEEYDRENLYCMFLKCYHHLPLVEKFEVGCAKQVVDEDCNLNIFLMDY
jgi:hypothetical protein